MMRILLTLLLALVALAAGCRDRDPNTPIALVSTPAGLGGRAVPLTYNLRNPDTVAVTVAVDFSTDLGATYRTATAAPGGEPLVNVSASPGGTTHVFLWNALADLGPGRHPNILLRVSPTLGGQPGTSAFSFPFTIDDSDIFVRTADLAFSRQLACAAPLPDGGALVAGGAIFAATEAFDPTSGATILRDALETNRASAVAATALAAEGAFFEPRALVVAGTGAAGGLDSVERYDPGADVLTAAGSPTVSARPAGHTVTRLLDNRVLVAGGGPGDDALISADGTTVATIAAGASRTAHAATLLPDGRVLLTGGSRGGAPLADTLIFSPATDAYSPGPSLSAARAGHAAALAGGRVLVAGGRGAAGTVLASAELADAALTTFTALPAAMTTPREDPTASGLADGTVLLVGGADAGGRALGSAERFFPTVPAFLATRGSLEVARRRHQATAIGAGRVLITGGGTDVVEVYYPQALTGAQVFDPIAADAAGRAEHQVTALADGRALITGGTDGVVEGGQPRALEQAEIFDPRARPDARLAPAAGAMAGGRRRHTATLLGDGRVLLAGGIDSAGSTLASLETFSPSTGTFTALAPLLLPDAVSEHTATLLQDGRVLVAGGRRADGSVTTTAAIIDLTGVPSIAVTIPPPALAAPRRRHTATLLGDGRVLVTGGIGPAGATASAEVLSDLATPTPTATALASDLGIARFDHAAVRLDDGTVLVAGGRGDPEGTAATPTADVRLFDPVAATLTARAPMLSPRADFAAAAALSGGRALLAGGAFAAAPATGLTADLNAPVTATAEIYTAAGAGSSAPAADPDLAAPRRGLRAATLTDGTTILIGGRGEAGVTIPGGERFVP